MFSRSILALMFAGALHPALAADAIIADESAVEAAFLYNFALFTDWPVLPEDEFSICVFDSAPVLAALEPIKKKTLKEHRVRIVDITATTQAQSCQILFVGTSQHASIGQLARETGKAPVLIVSEENAYDPRNVTIALAPQQGKLAFKINLTSAQARSLTLSSRLLKLALQVY